MGSIPICAARFGLIVLIGRITALQAEGCGFKSRSVHHYGQVTQLVECLPEEQKVVGSNPTLSTKSKKGGRKILINKDLYDKVYKIVDEHDPIGISWCSDDEYKNEVLEIYNRAYVLSEEELASYIYDVFRFWFSESIVPHPKHTDMYKEMAKEIKALFPTNTE